MAAADALRLFLPCVLLLQFSTFATGNTKSLTISQPLDFQVFQQQSNATGMIRIRGLAPSAAEKVRAQILGNSPAGPITDEPAIGRDIAGGEKFSTDTTRRRAR